MQGPVTVLSGVCVNPLGCAAAFGLCAGSTVRAVLQPGSAIGTNASGCVGAGFVWGKRVTSKCSNLLNPLLAKMKGSITSPRKERTFENQGSPVC